jgi:hypothetical protein
LIVFITEAISYVCARIEFYKIMRKTLLPVICILLLTTAIVYLSSCSKRDITNPPGLVFNQASGYIYSDTIVARGSTISIWVYANKIGLNDYLASATIMRSLNGSPDSIISSMRFAESQFSEAYSYQLGDSGNSYKYVFTFANQNGATTSDSLTVKTN